MKFYNPGGFIRPQFVLFRPFLTCDLCGGEIGAEELAHHIDGFAVCPDCFFDFCFDYFSASMFTGAEILARRGAPERKGRYV